MQHGVRAGGGGAGDEPQLPHHHPGRPRRHPHSCRRPRHVQVTTERQNEDPYSEMEFLDTNFTKDLSLLLHAIHSPFFW